MCCLTLGNVSHCVPESSVLLLINATHAILSLEFVLSLIKTESTNSPLERYKSMTVFF